MSDPYVWIDPFEEIERQKRVASRAREDGRQEVIRYIEQEHGDEFPKAIERAAYYLAERTAEEFLRPHLARHRMEYEEYQRRLRLEIDANMAVLRPAVHYVQQDGKLRFDVHERMDTGERVATTSVHTTRPFQYSVQLSPNYRRW